MKIVNLSLIILIGIGLSACRQTADSSPENKRQINFCEGWKFILDDSADFANPEFDDKHWLNVDLPHDWSVSDPALQDSLHAGPFVKGLDRGEDVAWLAGGTAWYRKRFRLAAEDTDKLVYLHFDGVQTEAGIWINGELAAHHLNGYTPFDIDITPYLKAKGEENLIALKVLQRGEHSRWFTGAGIYREVSMSIVDPLHFVPHGLAITTPSVNENEALVQLDVEVQNLPGSPCEVLLRAEITGPDSTVQGFESEEAIGLPSELSTLALKGKISRPDRWSPDHPALYQLRLSLLHEGKEVDVLVKDFGIRSIAYSAQKGFLLNDEPVLLKGTCMHHDNGLLGSMAFPDAEFRRVRIMKENGYNAIRCSHNPPSAAFLKACDKLGMLVIDEAFDAWQKAKRKNDYHLYFDSCWRKDLRAMIRRDRNHPSVIMWSFGNEVQERADPEGLEIAKKLIESIHSLDPSRPATQAICSFWDNPGLTWKDAQPALDLLDVAGYNYQWQQYESDHAEHPERIMYSSESFPMAAFENWNMVKKCPYVIGDFVWTGMDYLGESGVGRNIYAFGPGERLYGLAPWPWYLSWCGDIDITGEKKPQSWFRDIVWDESQIEMLVHEPVPKNQEESLSLWGWPGERKSWTWSGHEGEILKVKVYSSCEEVVLSLNGDTIGRKAVGRDKQLTAEFELTYTPGLLIAYGLNHGKVSCSDTLVTTGPPKRLSLKPEQKVIRADRQSLIYCRVEALDARGRRIPDSKRPFEVQVSGPAELLAAGNASPLLEGSLQDQSASLFRGAALLILRSTGEAGSINIAVSSAGLAEGANATVTAN
ncbi:MAG: glycoside hydrolase family 2 [Bacteroidetes bacterium]|nr:MAG: glycoside hydrolase family 2 [Bacteroidota bacterium]